MVASRLSAAVRPSELTGCLEGRWVGQTIRLRGLEVVLMALCLHDSEGFTNRNEALVDRATTADRAVGLPMLLIGDWNMPPAELAGAAWIGRQRMRIVVPDGGEASCISGPGVGRCWITLWSPRGSRTSLVAVSSAQRSLGGHT